MQNVSDKPVKWIGDDGGWKVGFVVVCPDGKGAMPQSDVLNLWYANGNEPHRYLVRETPGDKLTWVESTKLEFYLGDKTPKGE